MYEIIKPKPETITPIIAELPIGAVATWEGVALLVSGTDKPIYLFVVAAAGANPMLQFKAPKRHLTLRGGDVLMYHTGERVAERKFFNRTFLPTFFIFDNYFHAYAFEQKIASVGYAVQKQKFQ